MPDATMRASVLVDVQRMELRDVPQPSAGPSDVVIDVSSVGLCGSDFHIFSGESNYNFDERGAPVPLATAPQILGHEVTGIVREVGPEVRTVREGQRVVVDQGKSCGTRGVATLCEYCTTGDSHQCAHYEEFGITGLPGGLAERMAIPELSTVPLESDLSPAAAAMTEPLACVLHSSDRAARSTARYRLGATGDASVRSVLICGAGPAGLLFVQALRKVFGFDGLLLVSEPDAKKRELAASFGAEVLDPSGGDLVGEVLERTGGRRVEYLIEASGSGPVFEDIPALIRKQATVLLYGLGHGGASMELLNQVQWKEPTFVLSVGASGGFDQDGRPSIYRRALRMIESGTIQIDPMITHRYEGLEGVPGAFAGDHHEPGYVKGVVVV